jgi:hypothetical protein
MRPLHNAGFFCDGIVTLDAHGIRSYLFAVKPVSEDQLIRRLVIGSVVFAVGGLLATALIVVAMVSANFNLLNWLE